MATPDELATTIRFGLSQLSARNAHHQFEDLCRHLTRRRICANVLPATGPVAAGGDQGRDFETFRTYLADQAPELSSFVGLATDETIVFACTLQKEDIAGKIKGDVRSIVSQGTKVDRVYAFCETNVPVALRHRLQAEVLEEWGIPLELIDGAALAEMLTDPDVFWIAQRFLALPSEVLPELPHNERTEWYQESLERWRDHSPSTFTHGEFSELQRSLRHATFRSDLHSDVPSWIGLVERFRFEAVSPGLCRRASYEILVASLRGLGTLEGREEQIAAYYADIPALTEAGELEDAQVMITYLAVASARGLVGVPPTQVMAWRDELVAHVESLLEQERSPGRRCLLLQILGSLHFLPDLSNAEMAVEEHVDAALQIWQRLLELVPDTPLYPIDRFANMVSVASVRLADHPDYRSFTRRLDELVAERAGRATAAAKCRDRAMQFYKAERFTAALREFHQARVDWFAGDTIRGSLLASMLIARCYDGLHLHMAA